MDRDPNAFIVMMGGMNAWTWLIFGTVLLIAELFTGSTFILWPALAALIVGVVIFILPLGWEMQLTLFAILSVVGLVLGEKYLRPRLNKGEDEGLNNLNTTMKGRRVIALGDFSAGEGRVKVGDSEWRARMMTGNAKKGDELLILGVEGATVTVEVVPEI